MLYQKFFSISKDTEVVDIFLLNKMHKLKCRAVTGMETKLACIKQTCSFNVSLDYFQNNFLEYLARYG
jgi:hypothetical protein